ncbi:MAG: DegT/DnrJ/EryC1/StrS family aminotransferase, partial [Planctomycetota bacterium]
NQFTVRIQGAARDAVRQQLAERKIGTEVYYPIPLHQQVCFAYLGYQTGSLPETERACAEVLSLPIFPGLTAKEQATVVDTLADVLHAVRPLRKVA